jgi:UDP-GlcNAc:undecaprenyl-phosphate GlcNAc-1-phosphate transferase
MWLCWSALIILALGIADDIRELSAMTKLLFQLPAALMAVMAGPEISAIADPFTATRLDFAWLSVPLTVLWIVGITNAFNLIDGLDGLAAGTALISSATLVAVSLNSDYLDIAVTAAIMVGAVAGFLRYNFFPASMFLGDSGSMLLGYLLSVFYIQAARDESGAVLPLVPILALGLPIADTTLAVVRRMTKRPDTPPANRLAAWSQRLASVFRADREHIHHRLVAAGLTHRQTVLALYSVSFTLGALAWLATEITGAHNALLVGGIGIIAFLGLKKLGYTRSRGKR